MIASSMFCGDFLNMTFGERHTFDLVYADPPYGISEKRAVHVAAVTPKGGIERRETAAEQYDITREEFISVSTAWWRRVHEILLPTGWLAVSCTFHNLDLVVHGAKSSGFEHVQNIICIRAIQLLATSVELSPTLMSTSSFSVR